MNKIYKLAVLVGSAFSLAACQPVTVGVDERDTEIAHNEDCGIASETLVDEKVLFAAESGYNVAAHTYLTLDGAGKLSAEVKAEARTALEASYENLKLARAAYNAADGCKLKYYTDAVERFSVRARGLMPKPNTP